MNHDSKIALLKDKKLCMNCLSSGHFIKNCKSIHRCKKCQRSHHTLLHLEERKNETGSDETGSASANHISTAIPPIDADAITPAISATAIPLKSNTLSDDMSDHDHFAQWLLTRSACTSGQCLFGVLCL